MAIPWDTNAWLSNVRESKLTLTAQNRIFEAKRNHKIKLESFLSHPKWSYACERQCKKSARHLSRALQKCDSGTMSGGQNSLCVLYMLPPITDLLSQNIHFLGCQPTEGFGNSVLTSADQRYTASATRSLTPLSPLLMSVQNQAPCQGKLYPGPPWLAGCPCSYTHTYDRKLWGRQVAAAALQGSVPPSPLTLAQHVNLLNILYLPPSGKAPTLFLYYSR